MRFAVVGYSQVDTWWFDRLIAMGMWLERAKRKTSYARLRGTGGKDSKAVEMHNVVFGGPNPDHIDGDGLNNQESNLHPATNSQQMANRSLGKNSTSGEPGVCKNHNSWRVQVKKNRKVVFCKNFKSFDEAVQVARKKRREIHGEFVRQ
jgi:hypothetical protein